MPGTDRHPSQPSSCSSPRGVKIGLMSAVKGTGSASGYRGLTSKPNITTRRPTPICGAARPAPLRSRIVSRISASRLSSSGVPNLSTGSATASRRGSPILITSRIAMVPSILAAFSTLAYGERMPGRLYIKTFGCQMNEYDSGKMRDVLEAAHGMTRTDNPAEADVLLVNTCSVREKAQEKVFSLLGEWRLFKQQRPHVVIGVGGCVASQEGEGITARAPFVDRVFGPQTLHRLPAMLDGLKQSGRSQIDISFPEIEKFDRLPQTHTTASTAFVSIMEGCSKYCSFCVVPYTRGEEISRPFEQVLE